MAICRVHAAVIQCLCASFSVADPPMHLPEGGAYETDFINADEERRLIAVIATLPLREAQ